MFWLVRRSVFSSFSSERWFGSVCHQINWQNWRVISAHRSLENNLWHSEQSWKVLLKKYRNCYFFATSSDCHKSAGGKEQCRRDGLLCVSKYLSHFYLSPLIHYYCTLLCLGYKHLESKLSVSMKIHVSQGNMVNHLSLVKMKSFT